MIRVRLLKRRRREVKVDLKLGGQWNVPSLVINGMFQSLVANGMFQAWWLMECEGKKTFSPLSTSPPTNLLKLSIFFL
jgi:hypothetical protein